MTPQQERVADLVQNLPTTALLARADNTEVPLGNYEKGELDEAVGLLTLDEARALVRITHDAALQAEREARLARSRSHALQDSVDRRMGRS